MNYIDKYINSITMYKLVLYSLFAEATFAIFAALIGSISFGALSYIYSLVTLFIVCFFTNFVFAKFYKVETNNESAAVTALILFFVMFPATTLYNFYMLIFTAFVSMASKYILAINKRHIFNPVAFAGVALMLIGSGNMQWWIGSKIMFPIVLITGLIIVRKTRKFPMFLTFFLTSIFITFIFQEDIYQKLFSWPLIFFGTIMLTEPLTMPAMESNQIIYGFIVACLSSFHWVLGMFYSAPEIALVIGNIFAYFTSFKRRLVLSFKEKRMLAKDVFEFVFIPDQMPKFAPGQYLDWTIGHKADSRGNRRYFTIASSPTEKDIKVGVKVFPLGSSFKNSLQNLKEGDVIYGGNLAGDFVLPKDISKKLVFVAGGIGITPFRSMIQYIIDTKEKRDVVLFYGVKNQEEIAYKDIFESAEKEFSLKTIYLDGKYLTKDILTKEVPDFSTRTFYISGPNAMVENYKNLIKSLDIKSSNIITDYFPGF